MAAEAFVDALGVGAHLDHQSGIYFQNSEPMPDGGVPQAYQDLEALGVAHIRCGLSTNLAVEAKFLDLHQHFRGVSGSPVTTLAISMPDFTAAELEGLLRDAGGAIDILEPCNEPNLQLTGDWETEAGNYQQSVFDSIYQGGYSGPPVTVSISALGGDPVIAGYLSASEAWEGQGPWGVYQSVHSYPVKQLPNGEDGGDVVRYALPSSGDYKIREEEQTVWCIFAPDGGLICPSVFHAISSETGYFTCDTLANPACESGPGAASPDGISELAQGKYLPRLFVDTLQGGMERVYFYELYDEGLSDAGLINDHFGLIRNDSTRKPSFFRVQRLLATVAAAGLDAGALVDLPLTLSPASLDWMVIQNEPQAYQLLLWNDVPSYMRSGQVLPNGIRCDGGNVTGCDVANQDVVATVAVSNGAHAFCEATLTYLDPLHDSGSCAAELDSSQLGRSLDGGLSFTVCVPDEVTVVTLR